MQTDPKPDLAARWPNTAQHGQVRRVLMGQGVANGLILDDATMSSHFAEAYRALRANITFSSIDKPVRSVVVTSAVAGEGKTTTAINLGIVLAQSGLNVLVVDADFRRPSVHELLGIAGSRTMAGLSNLIVGEAEIEETILQSAAVPRLGIVPAGAMPPNPSELLGSQRMHVVLENLKQLAQVVILDSPPLMVYADALLIARMVDGVLYVLRAGGQDKSGQRRIQKQLEQAKARVLGVVFNAADVDEASYGYGYYNQNGKKRHK
jgi:capsular exopolysaccharide synthesis family protein